MQSPRGVNNNLKYEGQMMKQHIYFAVTAPTNYVYRDED